MSVAAGTVPVATMGTQAPSLRQRLRASRSVPTLSHGPSTATTCRIDCRWVGGSVDPRYQFRAVRQPQQGQRRIIARSPLFVSEARPVSPTPEASAALAALCAMLRADGWSVVPQVQNGCWYAHHIERATQSDL
jgi:hypothetical protein